MITVSEFSRARDRERLGSPGSASRWCRTAWTSASRQPRTPSPAAPRSASSGPTCSRSATRIARKNLAALGRRGRRAGGARRRAGGGRVGAGLHARRGRARAARARLRARRSSCPASTRGAAALAMPSLYEGFGLPVHRGDGVRHPGGGREPRRAPGGVRRRGPARGPDRRRRPSPTALLAATGTGAATRLSARRPRSGPRASPGSAPPELTDSGDRRAVL